MTISPYLHHRRKSHEVLVGNVGIGGDNSIRIQSMTTTPTADVNATVNQIIALQNHGCDIVRVTVQGKKEAIACRKIKDALVKRGCTIPIVADIHFYPQAALEVIEYVDKVRINPGNFHDKRATFTKQDLSSEKYAAELYRIEEIFSPLVIRCKELGKSIRIGVNHGSLSDRIMTRYGNTPEGMVQSALEYADICCKHDFHSLFFSMKASNPRIMMNAYRLLVDIMTERGWTYPLHLGVTEAGSGTDGRIKSAIGIGSLLLDGIGDTIRVSLTEEPWNEILPGKSLVRLSEHYLSFGPSVPATQRTSPRKTVPYLPHNGNVVLATEEKITGQLQPDLIQHHSSLSIPGTDTTLPIINLTTTPPVQPYALLITEENPDQWESIADYSSELLIFAPSSPNRISAVRTFFLWLDRHHCLTHVILSFSYDTPWDETVIRASAEYGSLLCDGYGNGIAITGNYPHGDRLSLSFDILQGCRLRTTKTEFISCPGCGRTLFDLHTVSSRIKERFGHLPNVTIAIMGCIVNGPGEMADADFGYVGSRSGKVDLYIGHQCVKKNVDQADAEDALEKIIMSEGMWIPHS